MLKRILIIGLFTMILGAGLTQAQPYVSEYFAPALTTVDADADTVVDDRTGSVVVKNALGANSYIVVAVTVEGPLDTTTTGPLGVTFGGTPLTNKVGGQADSTGGNSVHVKLFWLPVSSLAAGTYTVNIINGFPTGNKGTKGMVWLVADAVGVSDKAWNGYRDDDNPPTSTGGPTGYIGFNFPSDLNLLPVTPKVVLVPCTAAPGPSDDADLSGANQNDLALTLYFAGADMSNSAYTTQNWKDSMMGCDGTFSGTASFWLGYIKRNPMASAIDYIGQFNIDENSFMYSTTSGYLGADARVGGQFDAGWYRAGLATMTFAGSMANPVPADNSIPYSNTVTAVSWTNPTLPTGMFEYADPNDAADPNYPYYRAADPNFPGAIVYDLKFGTTNPPATVLSNVATTWTATASQPVSVTYPVTYYWQIVIKSAADSSKKIEGPVWTFTTKMPNEIPVITQTFASPIYYHADNSSAYIWQDELPADPNFATVQLCVDATDADLPAQTLTYLWEHIADSGPETGTLALTNSTSECGPIVKLKVTTIGDPYQFKFTVSDGTDTVSKTFSIQVAANPCSAAKRVPGVVAYPGDIAGADCTVDLLDFNELAQDWLKCQSLDCP
jgi:hypothetical protein